MVIRTWLTFNFNRERERDRDTKRQTERERERDRERKRERERGRKIYVDTLAVFCDNYKYRALAVFDFDSSGSGTRGERCCYSPQVLWLSGLWGCSIRLHTWSGAVQVIYYTLQV